MHIKNIRKIINKQLKTNHPYWKSMTRKSKKALAQETAMLWTLLTSMKNSMSLQVFIVLLSNIFLWVIIGA